ncbi:helix-turn-helix domain-containing protein [Brachybacterium tyrofermentans]|uniref:helix-turn-helix domain-containing protein n=1 Tax=Brachybacterium tyrofermentans TaxID=47848 RepID=UPI003FD09012
MLNLPIFVPLDRIMEELSISRAQAYALVRSGQLRAIQVGGRGQWRVSLEELDAYIHRSYEETARLIHQDSNS